MSTEYLEIFGNSKLAEMAAESEFIRQLAGNEHDSNIENAIEIAKILAEEVNIDMTAFSAVLWYYGNQNSGLKQIADPDTKNIIEGLQKIHNINKDKAELQTENFIKLLLTISTDIRTLLIHIAEMLYKLRTVKDKSDEEKKKIASEISKLYAPIAHRIGLYKIKTEMEEMSLKYLHYDTYRNIADKLAAKKKERDKYISDFIRPIKEIMQKNNIKCEIKGRPKSIYSIWKKIKKQGVDIDEIYDLFAIRIIIDPQGEDEKNICWRAYSAITETYHPNPYRLRDWISVPKSTGYESLHTTVIGHEGKWVEIQIRTVRMDEIAEKGLAAHWKYKEESKKQNAEQAENQTKDIFSRIREALENPSISKDKRSQLAKNALYSDEIFVFTPNGDLKKMKKGDTVIDFAFMIHSNIGQHCIGAVVNGKYVSIRYKLNNGDTVEVKVSSKQKPNYEWLNIANSKRVKNRIRKILRTHVYKFADLGKEMVKQKLNAIDIELNDENVDKLVDYFGATNVLEFYDNIGSGKWDINKVRMILKQDANLTDNKEDEDDTDIQETEQTQRKKEEKNTSDFLIISDLNSVHYQFAKCCNPIPGDDIFAFISVTKGVRIHRSNCPNAKQLKENYPYRIVKAVWNPEKITEKEHFLATIYVNGYDKTGMANSITDIISNEFKFKISALKINSQKDNTFRGVVVVKVPNNKELLRLMDRLRKIQDVTEVIRGNNKDYITEQKKQKRKK